MWGDSVVGNMNYSLAYRFGSDVRQIKKFDVQALRKIFPVNENLEINNRNI